MGKMRILSKKAFALGPGASRDGKAIEQFITVRGAIQEVDAAYKNDPTFLLAVKAGEIIVMNEDISLDANKVVEAKAVVSEEPVDLVKEAVMKYKEELKAMNAEQVREAADKYGAQFNAEDQLRVNKKRVLEAYKLSLSK